jgi:hypothetical protein
MFTIHYENGDSLVHGPWNNYYCFDITCPCHDALWTGALMSIDRDITRKQAAIKRSDPTPTEILPKSNLPIPADTADTGDQGVGTWEVPAPPRRRRTGFWQRVRRWFHR